MKKLLLFLITLLIASANANALTPTLPPSNDPRYRPIMESFSVRAFFDSEWHWLSKEMIWSQEKMPNGQERMADGMLHFMPLNEYIKDKQIPEATSLNGFIYQITIYDNLKTVSNNLNVYRQEGDDLQKLEELPENWDDLEKGRYLFSIGIGVAGNDSGANCVALLWANQ